LGLLNRQYHRKIRKPLADQHMQRTHFGEIGLRARECQPQMFQPRFHFGDVLLIALEILLIAGQQEAALCGDRSSHADLQLIDDVLAQRGFLQTLTGFLQPFLAGARQKKQSCQESDDQERGHRDVPPAEPIERFP
jgi:hypothetical protein